jgi:membrane protein implicated in regulation of membrane protease activity
METRMPLDKLVLIIVAVLAAAGITVWVAALAMAAFEVPGAGLVFVPAALVAYVVWRVISDRVGNKEDDHYDHIEK